MLVTRTDLKQWADRPSTTLRWSRCLLANRDHSRREDSRVVTLVLGFHNELATSSCRANPGTNPDRLQYRLQTEPSWPGRQNASGGAPAARSRGYPDPMLNVVPATLSLTSAMWAHAACRKSRALRCRASRSVASTFRAAWTRTRRYSKRRKMSSRRGGSRLSSCETPPGIASKG